MDKQLTDADAVLNRAKPLAHQHAHEIQPYRHLVAETTLIPRPPKGREEVPVQISRLLDAHAILKEARTMARRAAEAGDDGTNDLLVSDVIRGNDLQVWFSAEHVADVPLVRAL